MKRFLAVVALLAAAVPASAAQTADQRGQYYAQAPAMDATVEQQVIPQVRALLDRLAREKRQMILDGVRVFESGDKFLPGKIAVGMAYVIVDMKDTDPRLPLALRDFADIADLTIDEPNESWGIYYYMSALHQLKERGLLERAVRPATLDELRTKLDWRTFVRPGPLTLIDLPNNYFGVAFSVARLRFLMGWEDEAGSAALLDKTLDHYRRYSGAYGFADETDGEGRFDRYSVLLIGEIAHRLIETGLTPDAEVRGWLRKSVDLMLPRFNMRGEGFEYGRSIGTYGDTAFLEVLTAAARLKLLTPTEERMAYAFSARIAARYADFWLDPKSGSVNLWDGGRRTDEYRAKKRILGENLSLARQYIYTNAIWNGLGYRGRAPDAGYARWLDMLPASTTTWFARGDYDRLLVTIRDAGRVIGLPVINGAEGQHMNNPYFPVPFSPGMLSGSPDATWPQLVPRFTLADGAQLMPLAFIKNVKVARRGKVMTISWRQDALDRMGDGNARPDSRLSIETRYIFSPGRIERADVVRAKDAGMIRDVELQFGSFSSQAQPIAAGTVRFGEGEVARFATSGFDGCRTETPRTSAYNTPTGALRSVTQCRKGSGGGRQLRLGWTIEYRPPENRD